MLTLTGRAQAQEPVDPRNPGEWRARQAGVRSDWSVWPPQKAKQLREEIEQLQQQLSRLPRRHPISSQNRLGYHSSLEPNFGGTVTRDHQIDFALNRPFDVHTIAIVPVQDPAGPDQGAYGFPRRFRIEAFDSSGAAVVIADWMDEDFPDPGTLPVMFSGFETTTDHLRLTVSVEHTASAEGYFALGEVFIWGGNGESFFSDNLALWKTTTVTASDSLSLPPLWDLEYINDGISGLGFPLNKESAGPRDLMIISSEDSELSEKVQIVVDLGKPVEISRFDLWPAQTLDGPALPGVGFPGKVYVDVSNDPTFIAPREIEPRGEPNRGQTGALFSVCVRPPEVRYLRITLRDLQILNGKRALGLGEIALYDVKGELVPGRIHSAEGIPAAFHDQLPRLVDGYCWGRRVLSDLEWIAGLARRRPLEQRIAVLEAELASTSAVWQFLQIKLVAGAGLAGLLAVFIIVRYQRAQRRRSLRTQAERITRDLHDEVGSTLGGIALLADELARERSSKAREADLGDLSLMAREASASLGEIVKVEDHGPILLSDLLHAIQQRARRVLRGMKIEVAEPDELPRCHIPLDTRRHVAMLFKEAIHNCARHSGASRVRIRTTVENDRLCIEFADDGNGFDPAHPSSGWGLRNMRRRAEEIGGTLMISSRPGHGTKISFAIPVDNLSRVPLNPYQSSNT